MLRAPLPIVLAVLVAALAPGAGHAAGKPASVKRLPADERVRVEAAITSVDRSYRQLVAIREADGKGSPYRAQWDRIFTKPSRDLPWLQRHTPQAKLADRMSALEAAGRAKGSSAIVAGFFPPMGAIELVRAHLAAAP